MKKTISILLGTYNGQEYIEQQLETLLFQSRNADEILISDDCSTDNTVLICEKFIKKNNLKTWKIFRNKKNIGWRKNFYSLLKKATMEVIYFCDQDDLWNEKKIEQMNTVFENFADVKVLFSNYKQLVMENGINEPPRKVKSITNVDDKLEKLVLDNKFVSNIRPGCTMAFSKEILPEIIKLIEISEFKISHDHATYIIGHLEDSLYWIKKDLIIWRKHPSSAFKKEEGVFKNKFSRYVQQEIKYTDMQCNVVNWTKKIIDYFSKYESKHEELKKISFNRDKINKLINSKNIIKAFASIRIVDYRSEYIRVILCVFSNIFSAFN